MVGALIGWASLLINFSKQTDPNNQNTKDAESILDAMSNTYNLIAGSRSITADHNKFMIKPMVVIDKTILHQEYMNDLMTIVQLRDIAAALSFFASRGTINGIQIGKLVDQINPNRRGGMNAYKGAEAFGDGFDAVVGMQSNEPPVQVDGQEANPTSLNDTKTSVNGSDVTQLTEYYPLALGRTVMAEVSVDDKKGTFPISFRQKPVPVDNNQIVGIFKLGKPDEKWGERFLMHEIGDVTTPELLTGSDKIKEKFRLRDQELSGFYKEASDRDWNNKKASLRTGLVSLNTLANIFIISADTARQVRMDTGMDFYKTSGLAEVFKKVRANTIVIADEDNGVFDFFTYGDGRPETFTRNEIKVRAKKDNVTDLAALLKIIHN